MAEYALDATYSCVISKKIINSIMLVLLRLDVRITAGVSASLLDLSVVLEEKKGKKRNPLLCSAV